MTTPMKISVIGSGYVGLAGDLRHVLAATREFCRHMRAHKVVVDRIGTDRSLVRVPRGPAP